MQKLVEEIIIRINEFTKIEINKEYIFYISELESDEESDIEIKKNNSTINGINRLKKIVKTKSPLQYKN